MQILWIFREACKVTVHFSMISALRKSVIASSIQYHSSGIHEYFTYTGKRSLPK